MRIGCLHCKELFPLPCCKMQTIQVIHLLGWVDLFASIDHHAWTHTGNSWIFTPCWKFTLGLLSTPSVAIKLEDKDFFHSWGCIVIGFKAELFLGWLLLFVLDWGWRVQEKGLK